MNYSLRQFLQMTGAEAMVKLYNKSGKIELFFKEEETTVIISSLAIDYCTRRNEAPA